MSLLLLPLWSRCVAISFSSVFLGDDVQYVVTPLLGGVDASLHSHCVALADAYLPEEAQDIQSRNADEQTRERWRKRYFAALARLKEAHIPVISDEQEGAQIYERLREQWDPLIAAFARFMHFELPQIDP